MQGIDENRLLDYYLHLYDYELAHRESINARVTHLITVVVLLGGALVFFIEHPAISSVNDTLSRWWLILVGLGSCALLVAVIATASAWWGFRYRFAADPEAVERWREEMSAVGFAEAEIRAQLSKRILGQVASVTMHNRTMNKSKSRRAAAGRLAVLFAGALYGLATIPMAMTWSSGTEATESTSRQQQPRGTNDQ